MQLHDIDLVMGNEIQEIIRKPQNVIVKKNIDVALIEVMMCSVYLVNLSCFFFFI